MSKPAVPIIDVDIFGNPQLYVQHTAHNVIRLEKSEAELTQDYIGQLPGYGVTLQAVDNDTGEIRHETNYTPDDISVS
ncbi:hypothetical protein [Thalassospira lucentensis]|uniref:hypothetical protein n=1 Tax=Thalassospira lucentensis TaxID=168935 RepID=UPI003D2D7D82